MRYFQLFLPIVWLMFGGCGTATKAGPYGNLTADEKARQALDDEDYPKAIELYTQLIQDDPESYERYRFLAAAYAAEAGFDIIEVAKGSGSLGGSSSLLDSLGSFLPKDPTIEQLESMRLSKDTLLSIPAEYRSKDNTEVAYASGAAVQLEFYQSAYAIMYLNRFSSSTSAGGLDQDKLQTMTDADVDNILNNLTQVAASGGTGVPAAAQAVLSKVDQQDGTSNKDKLINYLNSTKKSA